MSFKQPTHQSARTRKERVEVAEQNGRLVAPCVRFGEHSLVLRQLFHDVRVRIDVRVEDAQLSCAEPDTRGEREAWSPSALSPRQIDAARFGKRQTAQGRDAGVARIVHADALFKIEIPLSS